MADRNFDLVLRLRANADGSLSVINRTTGELRGMGQAAGAADRGLSGLAASAFDVGGAIRQAAGGLALLSLAAQTQNLIDYADNLKLVDARVKVATSSAADYTRATEALLAVSLESHSSLAENANLFARTHKAIEQMGGGMGNTIAFADLLAKALKISGASVQESASVVRQMSQAFASGVLRGDEFNSIMENGSRLAFALADGLGVGVGELRKMAEAGELTAPKVLAATLAQAEKINDEFTRMPVTVAAAFVDVETQFGRYINAANTANGTTSTLAAGVQLLAHHLPRVLDAAILVGEGLALLLVSKGVGSLAAYTTARVAASRADAAAAAVLAAHGQALVEDARRTVALAAATVARTQSEIAATQATLSGTLSMGARMAATNTLNIQTRALTAATAAQTAAQAQLDAAIIANTGRISAMSVAMGVLNAAFAGVMGYQFGTWLNSFDGVADTATEVVGRWAQAFEDWGYRAEQAKAIATGRWGDLDGITAAHERNTQAIADNVQGSIEWRAALEKVGMTAEQHKSYLLELQTPRERFSKQTEEATRLFNEGLLPLDRYIEKLGLLRNEFDRLTELKEAPLNKYLADMQDKIDKLELSPLDYLNKKIPKDIIAQGGQAEAMAINARFVAAQAAQQQLAAAEKTQAKESKAALKDMERAHEAYVRGRIDAIGRAAATQRAALDAEREQVAFNHRQQAIGFERYAQERERLIRRETDIRVAEQLRQLSLISDDNLTTTVDVTHVTDQRHLAFFDSLIEKHQDLQKVVLEYQKTHQDITVLTNSEQASALHDRITAAYRDQAAALADLHRERTAHTAQYQDQIEQLKTRLTELTGTEREAFLARQAAQMRPLLAQARANQDPALEGLAGKIAQAETQKFDLQRAQAYAEQIRQIDADTRDLGLTSAQAFDIINQGAGGVANAFNGLARSLNQLDDSIAQNAANIARVTADHTLAADEKAGLLDAYAKKSKALDAERTASSLTGLRQIAGATADMFGENTKAREAFHAIEMTLGAVELANTLANTAATLAANAVAIPSNIATAASKIWSQMGIFAPIGLGVMAASLIAYGVGGFGGGNVEPPPASSPDTGTVLGDAGAQSESVSRVVDLLGDIHALEYPELQGINQGVNSVQAALGRTIDRLFQAGGLDTSNAGINLGYGLEDRMKASFTTGAGIAENILSTGISKALSLGTTAAVKALSGAAVVGATTAKAGVLAGLGLGSIAGPIGLVVGGLFTVMNMLFSGGYRSVVERGVRVPEQPVADALRGDFAAQQYNVVRTREWGLFWDKTRYDTVMTPLGDGLKGALQDMFASMGETSLALAEVLGNGLAERVNNYVIPELKVNLTDLNAEDAAKKLNAVISTALDTMAAEVFGEIVGQYQKAGEGMLETAARMAATLVVVRDAVRTSGLAMAQDAIAIANQLAEAAGGLDEFQRQFADYYEAFFSAAEQRARLEDRLARQLLAVNLALPASREGYRQLVEALDLSNATGRERYALLIRLAGAADEYYEALADGLDTYQDKVKSAYDTAAGLLEEQVNRYAQAIDQLRSFRQSLFSGNLSTATPAEKYRAASAEFRAIQTILTTGTAEQRADALPRLQEVVRLFLSSSQAFNAASLPYVRDLAAAEALLGKSITYAKGQKDVAQLQLDRLTDQVTALGLINASTVSVKTAVDNVGKAINELVKYQAAQAAAQNRARFDAAEAGRREAYEAPIAARAAAIGDYAKSQEGRPGWSSGSSVRPHGAAGAVDPSTGAPVGQISSYARNDEVRGAVSQQLVNVKGQFSAIGRLAERIVGGDLPTVAIALDSAGRGGRRSQSYTFAGISRTLETDDIDPLVRWFAKDAVGYLADRLGNDAWAGRLKSIDFTSIGRGFEDLSALMERLRRPHQAGVYDPLKTYALGGVARAPAIFGEAGPEAAVPLPDGRTIPVTLSFTGPPDWLAGGAPKRAAAGDNAELKEAVAALQKELADLRKLVAEGNRHAAANVVATQAGFKAAVGALQDQVDVAAENARRRRIGAPS